MSRRARLVAVAFAACVVCGALALALAPSREASEPSAEGAAPDAGDLLGSDEMGAEVGRIVGAADVERSTSEQDVEREAARALEELVARGDCVLVRSGYLDLSGRVWGCVVQGAGWAEVRLVSEGASGSEVVVLRMDADDARSALGTP